MESIKTLTGECNEENSSRGQSGNRIKRKSKTEGNMEMKTLRSDTCTSEESCTNRIQEVKEKILWMKKRKKKWIYQWKKVLNK